MHKVTKKRLALSSTTVRTLVGLPEAGLARVAGGLSKNGCNSIDLDCPGGTQGVCGISEFPCPSGVGPLCH
jgi:hypothetical protein